MSGAMSILLRRSSAGGKRNELTLVTRSGIPLRSGGPWAAAAVPGFVPPAFAGVYQLMRPSGGFWSPLPIYADRRNLVMQGRGGTANGNMLCDSAV